MDVSDLLDGKWKHVALTYRPLAGRGTWELFVEGASRGTLENCWRPTVDFGSFTKTFRFGADPAGDGTVSFQGGLDLWRISLGARTAETFLWDRPAGILITIR